MRDPFITLGERTVELTSLHRRYKAATRHRSNERRPERPPHWITAGAGPWRSWGECRRRVSYEKRVSKR